MSDGTGLGIGGILGDQERQRRKWESEAADRRRADKVARRIQPATIIPETNVSSGTQVDTNVRIFPKFVVYLSYPFLVVGIAVGYILSAGLAAYWPLAGAAAGGAVGFAVPGITYFLTLWLMMLFIEALEVLLEILVGVFRIAVVVALFAGAYYALQYYYG